MSGWWVVGSVSEAAFFGALFLLGIVSLTIVVSWQVFWPDSTVLKPGFGFWLMVIVSISFIVIGCTAFFLQVSQTLASPEMRSAMATRVKQEHLRRAEGREARKSLNLPSLQGLTDSPGVKLAYRLAAKRGESAPLILSAVFTSAWNSMVAVLFVVWVQRFFSEGIHWFLTVLLLPFLAVSYVATRWFFRLFKRQARLGPTAVEIDALPMLPGGEYQLYVCQYGRIRFQRLTISLSASEETTYHQGTDVRTESCETLRLPVSIVGDPPQELVAEPEKPLELDCTVSLPFDTMHSFQTEHSAIVWHILVEGDCPKWPGFCRKFPVVVYPRDAV